MAPPGFSYRLRLRCVCARPLAENARIIRKHEAWGEVNFRRCDQCGSFVQSPEIVPESLAAWYDSDAYQGSAQGGGAGYHNYLADEDSRLIEAHSRYQRDLAPHLPKQGRILEIGCATGSLLAIARDAGHECVGIDLSQRFIEFGRERHNLDLHCVALEGFLAPQAPFDMIVILGTISNLIDPLNALQLAHAMLRPGGMVLINLPFADSIVARLYGERFWMFTPSVNSFYSRGGVSALLNRAGFEVDAIRPDVQRPSFGKLAHHLKVRALSALVRATGLGETRLPFSLPLPGIFRVLARKPRVRPLN